MHGSERSNGQMPLQTVRAAIYTRVSTDEGLGQEFNSLDAQREAGEAYITSQKHEGWILVTQQYDDGGYSGGTMRRPALEQLLADVRAGRIDTVVVYKIDRLTRSLADFSKIVEVLDAHGASFISITQAFSTTTSMGRLTLNVLLSFAQFEREVGAERVRDKIASSKKKGMWMGGVVPLGYDVKDRKLLVNNVEAQAVRQIFALYIELGSAGTLHERLVNLGIVSKRRTLKSGKVQGGQPFTRGALYNLLQNVTYVGEVAHRGERYPGQHKPIVDRAAFEAAQSMLAKNRADRRNGRNADQPSLLAGMIYDGYGRPMSPSHTSKGTRRFRYYFSRKEKDIAERAMRVPAAQVEKLAIDSLTEWLTDPHRVHGAIEPLAADAPNIEALLLAARRASDMMNSAEPFRVRELLGKLIDRVTLYDDRLVVLLNAAALFDLAELPAPKRAIPAISLETRCKLIRRSREVRLAIAPSGKEDPLPDPALIKLIVKAHIAKAALFAGTGASLAEIAEQQGYDPFYFKVLVKLAFLAPDITAAILEGKQPPGLTRQKLARINFPPLWSDQRTMLGFF